MSYHFSHGPHRSRGFSLVELMVGLVIGTIAILVVLQVFALSEGSKRTTTGGDDAQNAGAIALVLMQRDLRQAGYGISSVALLGCNLALPVPAPGTATAWTLNALAPVTINHAGIPAGDANTDTLLLVYGSNSRLARGRPRERPAQRDHLCGCDPDRLCGWRRHRGRGQPEADAVQPDAGAGGHGDLAEPAARRRQHRRRRHGQRHLVQPGPSPARAGLCGPRRQPDGLRRHGQQLQQRCQRRRPDDLGADRRQRRQPARRSTAATRRRRRWTARSTTTRKRRRPMPAAGPACRRCASCWSRAAASSRRPTVTRRRPGLGWRPALAQPVDLSSTANWQRYRYKIFETTVPLRNMAWQGVQPGC